MKYDDQQVRAWAASLDVAVGLLGFGFIGWLIDRWLGHAPWWMLGLGVLGLIGGSYRFIREAMAINRTSSDRSRRSRQTGRRPENPDRGDSPGV